MLKKRSNLSGYLAEGEELKNKVEFTNLQHCEAENFCKKKKKTWNRALLK